MATYMCQGSYTPEAWAAMLAHPVDRTDVVRPVIEKMGGKLVNAWFAFGDSDIFVIAEMPSNVEAAALALTIAAGGAFKSMKTTPLMSVAEGIEAMKKAAQSGYKAPLRK
jgi:uncharacterized protein with GYD domain